MLEITSASNALFKKLQSLLESKGLKKEGLFILSGKNLVQEFLKNPTLEIESELLMEGYSPLCPPKLQVKLSKTLFEELDVLGTKSNLLVLKQPELSDWDFKSSGRGLKLLTPLGDPANLGALLRSAEAFGVSDVILLRECANPFLPKAVKGSAGSITRLKLWKGPTIKELSAQPVVALDLKGERLSSFQWPINPYLLIGEEGAGIPSLPDLKKISIPTRGVESLNATVAASLALYDYSQKHS